MPYVLKTNRNSSTTQAIHIHIKWFTPSGIPAADQWQFTASGQRRNRRSHSSLGDASGRPIFARISGRTKAKWLFHHMPDAGAGLWSDDATVAPLWLGRIDHIFGHSCYSASRWNDRGNGAGQSTVYKFVVWTICDYIPIIAFTQSGNFLFFKGSGISKSTQVSGRDT